jgi:hypothetical protein
LVKNPTLASDAEYAAGRHMGARVERSSGDRHKQDQWHAGLATPLALLATAWLLAVGVGTAAGSPAHDAAARQQRRVVYCTRHHHPRGCIAVPKAAKRPHEVSQQGSAALTPSDVANGGGLGGGPGNHRAAALRWASSQQGQRRWAWRCERFVEEAYGTRAKFATAAAAATTLALHHGAPADAPAGSLMYFAADRYNRHWGHTGLSVGHGRMISALTTVQTTNVARSAYWRRLYLGWADAPASWPGRIPPPPGPTTTDPDLRVRITAPAPGSPQSGTIPLLASALDAGGVEFLAYFASDTRDPDSRHWASLGRAVQRGDTWDLDWDTTTIPDQGLSSWGTVNIAAVALDSSGQRTGTRDYRRISIENVAQVPNTTIQVATTYPETTGGYANTWSDYRSAGGTSGQGIPGGVTVQIACKVTGFQVPDGNTWWYRIAQAPWSGQFYVTADAFYNNGQTSGTLHGTPFVDPAVPTCT